MKKLKLPQSKRKDADRTPQHHFSAAKLAYMAFLCVTMSLVFCQPAFAATDVWSKAKEIMQDVYKQIVAISTIAAIVTASVALLLMNFSRSGRTVDESRAWLKRHLYHLGDPQRIRLYHGLCDAPVCRRSVGWMTETTLHPLEGGVIYGYPGWHR